MNISPLFPNHTTFALNSEKSLFKEINFSDLELLLKLGANVNETEKEFNLNFLQKCMIDEVYKRPEFDQMVNLLINYGIDVNHQDVDGCTALHFAICDEQYDLAKLLLNNGADPAIVDKRGESPYDDLVNLANPDPSKADQRKEMLQLLQNTDRFKTSKEAVQYMIDHRFTYANLTKFQDFNNEDLKNLSENCRQLKELSVKSIKFSETNLADALEKWTDLKSLNLSWCIQIRGDSLAKLHHIRHLNLTGCKGTAPSKLLEFSEKADNLQSLNLKWLQVSADDLGKIAKKHPLIQIID